MKRFLLLAALVCTLFAVSTTSASAQFHFGVKAGATVSDLSLKEYSTNNITSFTGGVMGEFTIPIVGLGVDASLMYTRKGGAIGDVDIKRDYLDVPVNLKWKIGLPFVNLFVATGPGFSFLLKDNFGQLKEDVRSNNFDLSYNLGGGIQIMKVQLAVQHSWGLTAYEIPYVGITVPDVKNNYWTVTAAYLF